MSDALRPWPRFATTEVYGSALPNHLAGRFPRLLVPSEGIGGLSAADSLSLILEPGGSELIQFGHYSYGPVCLDPATGTVVDMVGAQEKWVRGPMLVNSTLDQFVRTTRAATELFPFVGTTRAATKPFPCQDDPDIDLAAAANAPRSPLELIDLPLRAAANALRSGSNRSIRLHGITTDSGATSTGALQPASIPRTISSPRLTEVEWPGLFGAVEGEAGLGEESVDEFGSVLDAFEPVADDAVQVIQGSGAEVAESVLDV